MKLLLSSLSIGALLAAAATSAHADKPAWCGTPGLHDRDTSSWNPTDDDDDQLYALVTNMCRDANDQEMADNGAKWTAGRTALMKKLELTDADWNDAAVWAAEPIVSARTAPTLHAPEKKAWSAYDAVDQYEAIGGGFQADDANYLADALGARLTETGKLAYIERCLKGTDEELPVRWAMCASDIASFDPKKVQAELHADTAADGEQRTMIRLHLAAVRAALPKHASDVKALVAKDDGYAKIFAIADQTSKDWDAKAGARASLLDLALAMDDARATNSRKALAGCDDKTWAAWTAAVSGIPAKRFEHLHDDAEKGKRFSEDAMGVIAGDPAGYLAAMAIYRCHADDSPQDYLIRTIGGALKYWPGFRGPRTAIQTAILQAGIVLDDKDARLDYPGISREFQVNGSSSGGGEGAIVSAKPVGKTLHVVFARKMEKEEVCTNEKTSNRVSAIRSDGSLEYDSTCYASKMISVDRSSDPRDVQARYAAGMKGGAVVDITEDVVDGVWAKAGASMPSVVYGAPVK